MFGSFGTLCTTAVAAPAVPWRTNTIQKIRESTQALATATATAGAVFVLKRPCDTVQLAIFRSDFRIFSTWAAGSTPVSPTNHSPGLDETEAEPPGVEVNAVELV